MLDYQAINGSITGCVFQADTTYLITNTVYLYGKTTIECGTVIKIDPSSYACLDLNGPVNCSTGPYRPAIFTSSGNNTVGQTISGSSGSPTLDGPMLTFEEGDDENLSNIRFISGINIININSLTSLHVRDCQFVGSWHCIVPLSTCNIYLYNVLFSDLNIAVMTESENITVDAEQVTFDGSPIFDLDEGTPVVVTCSLTNCLLYDGGGELSSEQSEIVANGGSLSTNATFETTISPFQSVGAGNYYSG